MYRVGNPGEAWKLFICEYFMCKSFVVLDFTGTSQTNSLFSVFCRKQGEGGYLAVASNSIPI